jgi:hypothetical protein
MNQDFRGFLQFAEDSDYREHREGYLSKCHLCADMRKHLIEKGEFQELKPVEFYTYLE